MNRCCLLKERREWLAMFVEDDFCEILLYLHVELCHEFNFLQDPMDGQEFLRCALVWR